MKKIARILTATVAIAGAVMGVAPAAQAAPGNTVLLGDSYFANTSFKQLFEARTKGGPKCIQGNFRVATELQRLTGARVDDYSCNGKELYRARATGSSCGSSYPRWKAEPQHPQRANHGWC